MGTWHCLIIFYKGKVALAHQGSYDGSPEYVGRRVLDFIRDAENVENVKRGLSYLRPATKKEKEERSWFKRQIREPKYLQDADGSKDENGPFPTIEADHASEILPLLAKAGSLDCQLATECQGSDQTAKIPVTYDINVMFDGEFGYVLDLDNDDFEVYFGLIESDAIIDDRFENFRPDRFHWMSPNCIKSYKLSSLPATGTFVDSIRNIVYAESDESNSVDLNKDSAELR